MFIWSRLRHECNIVAENGVNTKIIIQQYFQMFVSFLRLSSRITAIGILCLFFRTIAEASTSSNKVRIVSSSLNYVPFSRNVVSSLKIMEQSISPDNNVWSVCQFCCLKADRSISLLRNPSQNRNINIYKPFNLTVSSSQWREFFHSKTDVYSIQVQPTSNAQSQPKYIVNRPIFLLPVITFHIGHWLIDVLESLYHSMMSNYGRIRPDSLIVIDVANSEERLTLSTILQNALYGLTNITEVDKLDNVYQLIFAFTELPILTADEFFGDLLSSAPDDAVFENLHIGLDTSKSFYYRGFRYHPNNMNFVNSGVRKQGRHNQHLQRLIGPHRQFQRYLRNYIDNLLQVKPSENLHNEQAYLADVLVVQRTDNRIIKNLDEVVAVFTDQFELSVAVVTLEDLKFRQQLNVFRKTKIVMGVGGTTFHNLVFLTQAQQQQGTHGVILLMQSKEWCDFAWMYQNQATILGSRTEVICPEEHGEAQLDEEKLVVALARRMTKQGPRTSKLFDVTVNISHALIPALQNLLSTPPLNPTPKARKVAVSHHFDQGSTVSTSYNTTSSDHGGNYSFINSEDPGIGVVVGDVSVSSSTVLAQEQENFLANDENSSQYYTVKLLAESFGPMQELKTLLDHRYFPYLSFCAIVGSTPQCLRVDNVGYLGDFRIVANMESMDLVTMLKLTPSSSIPVEANVVLNSSAAVSLNLVLHQQLNISTVVMEKIGTKLKSRLLGFYNYPECELKNAETRSPIDFWIPETDSYGRIITMKNIHCSNMRSKFTIDIPESAMVLKDGSLMQDLSARRQLQRRLGEFCRFHGLDTGACGYISSIVNLDVFQQHVLVPALQLPYRQTQPSAKHPFVFLHMEKCAGTSVRELVDGIARKYQYAHFIPCYSNVSCFVYDLPRNAVPAILYPLPPPTQFYIQRDLSNLSVVAGHFQWGVWNQLPACQQPGGVHFHSSITPETTSHTADNSMCTISCFVMFRDPVERVVSQYYERIYNEKVSVYYQVHLNELDEETWRTLLYSYRWGRWREDGTAVIVDDGFSDVYCRSLLGRKTTSGKAVHFDERDKALDISPAVQHFEDVQTAIQRMQHCVIGLQHRWNDTVRVLSHWFPWMDYDEEILDKQVHVTKDKQADIVKNLRPELRRAIEEFSSCDIEVYEYATKRFDMQLDVLKSPGYI